METLIIIFVIFFIHWLAILKRPLVIGHRGFINESILPNTEQAFDKAIRYQVDYIECDVRMINNILVISHDKIYEHTEKGLKPMLLKDWLNKYKNQTNLLIEYKKDKDDKNVEYEILKLIQDECKGMKYNIILQSFSKETVEIFKKEQFNSSVKIKDVSFLIKDKIGNKIIFPNYIGYHFHHLVLPQIFLIIQFRLLLRKRTDFYTVNKYWEMILVDFIGCNGIITDRADKLKKVLKYRIFYNILISLFSIIFIYFLIKFFIFLFSLLF